MQEHLSYSDVFLFARISNGDEQAFRQVFHEHNAKLYHTTLKLIKSETEAQEIVQEVFLRLWLNRASLPKIDRPVAWLYRVASNLSLDALRRQARQRRHAKKISEQQSDILRDYHYHLEEKEIQGILSEAITKLPPSRRQIFILSRQQGLNRKEIAEKLNLSESTVKNQLTSALRFLQDYLYSHGGIPCSISFILLMR